MNRLKKIGIAIFVAVSLLSLSFVFGAGIAALFGVTFAPETSQDLAAWVQAVGSILAIVGTVWAVSAGARAASRQQDERLWRAVLAVANAALERVNKIAEALKKPALDWEFELANCYVRSIMDGFSAALREIPAHQLPSQKAVTSFLMLQQHLSFFTTNIDKLNGGLLNDPAMVNILEKYTGHERDKAIRDLYAKNERTFKIKAQHHAKFIGGCVQDLQTELILPV